MVYINSVSIPRSRTVGADALRPVYQLQLGGVRERAVISPVIRIKESASSFLEVLIIDVQRGRRTSCGRRMVMKWTAVVECGRWH